MRRPRIGVRGLADDLRAVARTWAEETAQAQGLGPKVNGEVLASVALLLGAEGSGAPDGGKARGVELVEPAPAGADDDVIEDGGDDLLLAS
jgi:hypothetical protein